jgi:hypothetical protein
MAIIAMLAMTATITSALFEPWADMTDPWECDGNAVGSCVAK